MGELGECPGIVGIGVELVVGISLELSLRFRLVRPRSMHIGGKMTRMVQVKFKLRNVRSNHQRIAKLRADFEILGRLRVRCELRDGLQAILAEVYTTRKCRGIL